MTVMVMGRNNALQPAAGMRFDLNLVSG